MTVTLSQQQKKKLNLLLRKLGFMAAFAALLSQMILIGTTRQVNAQNKQKPAATPAVPVQLQSKSVKPQTTSEVSLRTLTSAAKKVTTSKASAPKTSSPGFQPMPVPGSIREVDTPAPSEAVTTQSMTTADVGGPLAPSPGPAQNFQGAIDEAFGGGPSGTFTIPPDTMGAVGLDKVVSFLSR